MNNNREKECYFAAANSYRGFVSYFDKVFNSKKYERIYVLKGGPGTGKSSLMKKISEEMTNAGCCCREILCSSDPHSLDGIIISCGNKRVAVLDGTAPHERDAVIPGAVDEIINLGTCWDSRWLRAKRDMIDPLVSEKQRAYSTAYSYLQIAGKASDFIYSVYSKIFDKNKAKIKADQIFNDFGSNYQGDYDTFLISSFGKTGEYGLDTANRLAQRQIRIGNNKHLAALFLDCCFDVLKQKNTHFTHMPFALESQHTEALLIPQKSLLLCFGKDGEINTDELSYPISIEKEQIKCAESVINISKEEAGRWFAVASDLHFRLEEIYSQAMNFEEIDGITEEKTKEIRFILDI